MSDIAKLLAELREWEVRQVGTGRWVPLDLCSVEALRGIAIDEPDRLRRKPKTVTLTVTMPQPLKTAVEGQEVWFYGKEERVYALKYDGSEGMRQSLAEGRYFATESDAEAADAAMSAARLAMMEAVK